MNDIRQMLTLTNADDYELENPREQVDYGYFGKNVSQKSLDGVESCIQSSSNFCSGL